MTRAFTELMFTPAVKAAQTRYGSRQRMQRLERVEDRADELTEDEAAFIEARDGFYQATVSESGWPYVQFRGGPVGFLKVIDKKTIGYADFGGNVQYLSVGNLTAEPRVALILMDYANQARLKLWGRARITHASDEPELLSALTVPNYKARVERAIIISIEAFDWNCPQHITPRYTRAEVEAAIAPLRAEIEELKSRLAQE
jgi:predicted pyridoxine 5'-phosphate oxidase superfamily flavin-nucleotide-binding protein